MTNKETALQAIAKADFIYAKGEVKSSEFTIRVQDYSNTVATNLSPDSQVALMLEDTAKAICQKSDATFDESIDLLEKYVEAKKIGYMCRI